jgi:hypothetical protein
MDMDISTTEGIFEMIRGMVAKMPLVGEPDPDADRKRQLAEEARYYEKVMVKKLTQLGICYKMRTSEQQKGMPKVKKIGFSHCYPLPQALYYRIDTLNLPHGVSLADIDRSEILDDLSVSCQRPVKYRRSVKTGAWLIVEREGGLGGIPAEIEYRQMLKAFPRKSTKALLIPLGAGENRRLVFESLASMPHMLVGGATGAGKTTFVHALTCALIRYNSPDKVRMAWIDLKGGIEAGFYKGTPHMLQFEHDGEEISGLIKDREGVVPLLQHLNAVVEHRLIQFEKQEPPTQNLAAWNHTHSPKLPRVVLFVDEMANIMLDSSIKKHAQSLLADITARGRAPGVHVVLATQRPEVAVVPGLIKANLDARAAFYVPDNASSMVILDNTLAAQLPSHPGRFIYSRGMTRDVLQSPWIDHKEIEEIVARAKKKYAAEPVEVEAVSDVVPDLDDGDDVPHVIFKVAVEQLNGSLSRRKLYDVTEGKFTMGEIQDIVGSYDGVEMRVNGEKYVVLPPAPGKARKIKPIEGGA